MKSTELVLHAIQTKFRFIHIVPTASAFCFFFRNIQNREDILVMNHKKNM